MTDNPLNLEDVKRCNHTILTLTLGFPGVLVHKVPICHTELTSFKPIAKKLALATGAVDFNILQNNGRIAHQVVDHVSIFKRVVLALTNVCNRFTSTWYVYCRGSHTGRFPRILTIIRSQSPTRRRACPLAGLLKRPTWLS